MNTTKELKNISKVRLKSDNRIYYVYTIYSNKYLSLCLYGYNDVEQDFKTNIKEIELI